MEFSTPYYSIFALIGLICYTVGFFRIGKKAQLYLSDKYLKKSISFRRAIVYFCAVCAWVSISISLMGPRTPIGNVEGKIEANDILFLLDTSGSMKAVDFKPNRMEVAKAKILEFVDMKPTDRMGLIVFASKPFTLMPLTTDLELVKEMISQVIAPFPGIGSGTNIGDALALAAGRASQSLAKNKVIILLTDGASNLGTLNPLEAAEKVKAQNIKVYSIGIGSKKDSYMPDTDAYGRTRMVKIPGGGFDMDTLQKISDMTGGKSYSATSAQALKTVLSEINKLEKSEVDSFGRIVYQENYLKYLIVGVLLLALAELSRRLILREGI